MVGGKLKINNEGSNMNKLLNEMSEGTVCAVRYSTNEEDYYIITGNFFHNQGNGKGLGVYTEGYMIETGDYQDFEPDVYGRVISEYKLIEGK